MSLEELLKEAELLPIDSKLVLAEKLMLSINSDIPDDIEESHIALVEKRAKEPTDFSDWIDSDTVLKQAKDFLNK
jgi:hypothetical protein